ncbi:diacylglycerol/lipid kinase family protein [Faecalimonas sp.]
MYTFIVNPHSRSGKGAETWEEVRLILEEKRIPFSVHFTQYQRHATSIMRTLTSDSVSRTVIILGGDGTINEAINGIQDFTHLTLGYIPTGSGNDFARGYSLPTNPREALNCILNATHIRLMDIGELSYKNKKRRFAVSCGIGYDAAICHEAVVSTIKPILNRFHLGKLTYAFIAIRQLLFLTPYECTITLNNKEIHHFSKCYFVSAMNHRYEGGGVQFGPHANPEDHLLSICAIADVPKWKLLFLLASALFGKHSNFKGSYLYNCEKLSVQYGGAMPVHTDGEPVFLQKDISVSCLSEHLHIITNK